METPDFVKDKSKKIPGLGWVAASLSAVIALSIHKSSSDFGILVLLVVWGSAYCLYRIGSCLDNLIFRPLYSANKDLNDRYLPPPGASKLDRARQGAARKLLKEPGDSQTKRYPTSGLYETAEKLFGKSDDWDRQVRPWLNLSKAARTFVIPLIVILSYDGVCNLTNWRALEPNWLANSLVWSILSAWPVALIMLITSSFLYLWCRVKHMVALYKLIETASVFRFTVNDDQQKERKIVCVANMVSPADELVIFGPQPAGARTSSGGARPDELAAHKANKESSAGADEFAVEDAPSPTP